MFRNKSAPEALDGPRAIVKGVVAKELTVSSAAVRVTVTVSTVEVNTRGTAGEVITSEGLDGETDTGKVTVPTGAALIVTVNIAVEPSARGETGASAETIKPGSSSTTVMVARERALVNDPTMASVGGNKVTMIVLSPVKTTSLRIAIENV